ncbi:Acyl-CoA Delta(11) desaturase [Orchesella cincta]|uniref:Acyl-CoA Delta(11) desaturase n=1 Tax=Orchesella cincta TaxID=48709 RepID=A0A1D2MIS1_ORCCI|nr:Acyl-CoA Delta(11) desaturase [Orchesella cincta]
METIKNNRNCKEDEEETVRRKEPEYFLTFESNLGLEAHIFNRLVLGTAHAFAFYHVYLSFRGEVPNTFAFEFIFGYLGGLGITVGCHRYWTHRTFKATLPLQILLMILQTIASQNPIRKWCLDHRIHHKYTDTDADPHNSKRGFWFSHIGWQVLPKHPDFQRQLRIFDVSDLDNDPVVRFQSRWFWPLSFVFHIALPIYILQYFWPEMTLIHCIAANFRRYVYSLHVTFSVNSIAHMWGDKPYDKNITAVENWILSLLAIGEGWHNFHHTFPWDYKTSEFGWKMNFSTMLIDFFAWIGWAYDRKTASPQLIRKRMLRTGNGNGIRDENSDSNHHYHHHHHEEVSYPGADESSSDNDLSLCDNHIVDKSEESDDGYHDDYQSSPPIFGDWIKEGCKFDTHSVQSPLWAWEMERNQEGIWRSYKER